MDTLVALMTENFHESMWTDQEIGVALGCRIPIISVKLGQDPYGFIGKYQALSCTWKEAGLEIAKLLINNDKMKDTYINALYKSDSFDNSNLLAKLLPEINSLTNMQLKSIMNAFNENNQVYQSYSFNNEKPQYYEGLAYHLNRISGRNFIIEGSYTKQIVELV